MTQSEISKYLDIPFATLNDWKKQDSNRYTLYRLLVNLDKNVVDEALNKTQQHRIFHILNRNIDENSKFSFDEIKNAFKKSDYHDATIKEQTIYSKFFKELDVNELESFIKTFGVSKRDIKNIYITSPFRKLVGVSKKWDRRFRLKSCDNQTSTHDNALSSTLPSILQSILSTKSLNV